MDIDTVTSPGTISFIDGSMGGLVSKDITTHGGWKIPQMIKMFVSSPIICFHLSIDVDIGELYWEDKYFPEVVQRQQLVHSWPVETSAFSSILTTVRIVRWR